MRARREPTPTFNQIKDEYERLMRDCHLLQGWQDATPEQETWRAAWQQARGNNRYAIYQYEEAVKQLQSMEPFIRQNPDHSLSAEFLGYYQRFQQATSAILNGTSLLPTPFRALPPNTAITRANTEVFAELRKMRDFHERFCTKPEPYLTPTAEQTFWARTGMAEVDEVSVKNLFVQIEEILTTGKLSSTSDVVASSFIVRFNRHVETVNRSLGYGGSATEETPVQFLRVLPQTYEVDEYIARSSQRASRAPGFMAYLKKAWYDAMLPLADAETLDNPDAKQYLFGYIDHGYTRSLEVRAINSAFNVFYAVAVFAAVLVKRLPQFLLFNLPAEFFNWLGDGLKPAEEKRAFSFWKIPEMLFRGVGLVFEAAVSPIVFLHRLHRFMEDMPVVGGIKTRTVLSTIAAALYVAAAFAILALVLPPAGGAMLMAVLSDLPLIQRVDDYSIAVPFLRDIIAWVYPSASDEESEGAEVNGLQNRSQATDQSQHADQSREVVYPSPTATSSSQQPSSSSAAPGMSFSSDDE